MKFDEDLDENTGGIPVIYMSLGVSLFILMVLGVVLIGNSSNKNNSGNYQAMVEATKEAQALADAEATPTSYDDSLTANDLDIWDMYPKNAQEEDYIDPKADVEASEKLMATPTPEASKEIDYDDGEHVKITYADGSVEWVKINDKWAKNTYDFTNLVNSGGKMRYYSDGKNVSFLGIDVSKYQGTVDFTQVKDQDIDFVMIRVGQRGYKTGALSMDDNFETNFTKATEAGLDVGVYFYSQAVTTQEALDEANMVLNALNGRKLAYPVAFDMESVSNDTSRIDTLDKDERLLITQTFVDRIVEGGYKAMVYGNKEWLLKKIDISKLNNCSIWLSQDDDVPDYPYTYSMWQYTTDGSVYGIEGAVDMDICFIDYSAQ